MPKTKQAFSPLNPIRDAEFFANRASQITMLREQLDEQTSFLLIHGERGVGKTSLANLIKSNILCKTTVNSTDSFSSLCMRLFNQVQLSGSKAGFNTTGTQMPVVRMTEKLPTILDIDVVSHVIQGLASSQAAFVIAEFDRIVEDAIVPFAELVKSLSDSGASCHLVFVGTTGIVGRLRAAHPSISRHLTYIELPRMTRDELAQIIHNAENVLDIKFSDDAINLMVFVSQGLPHFIHLIGQAVVKGTGSKGVGRDDVLQALGSCMDQSEHNLRELYDQAVYSAQRDAQYRQVLLACAMAGVIVTSQQGFFNAGEIKPILEGILHRKVVTASYHPHLQEFISKDRGAILERHGQPRKYRYRFSNPFLVPYVLMNALSTKLAD